MNSAAAASLTVPPLLGEAPTFRALKSRLPLIARAMRTTLISGPTGSGKDVIARTLHANSPRAPQPYVPVHCAALPETLVESEMFGHSRGAFTGADRTRSGLVRTAEHGTIFLDEVDSLPATAQAKLLRFLETGEYRAVGADRVEHADVWIIAATNQDLGSRVRAGGFRADLMFRLAVVKLDVPRLVGRGDDILALAEHFLNDISGGTKRFSHEALRALLSYDWPGNVRELKHRVESAALFSEAPTIDASALDLAPAGPGAPKWRDAGDVPAAPTATDAQLEQKLWGLVAEGGFTFSRAMAECERLLIHAALQAEGNNRTRAAGRLGIHVRTIFKKLTDKGHPLPDEHDG
jgi:DNA-binding NtrC family response regulator